jgi:hypothetical protein
LLLLLREHNVEDAAPWLHREGVTLRGDLLDVTVEDVQGAGLPKFVAKRFVAMLEGLRDAAGGGGTASEAPVVVSLEGVEMEVARLEPAGKEHTSEDVAQVSPRTPETLLDLTDAAKSPLFVAFCDFHRYIREHLSLRFRMP